MSLVLTVNWNLSGCNVWSESRYRGNAPDVASIISDGRGQLVSAPVRPIGHQPKPSNAVKRDGSRWCEFVRDVNVAHVDVQRRRRISTEADAAKGTALTLDEGHLSQAVLGVHR